MTRRWGGRAVFSRKSVLVSMIVGAASFRLFANTTLPIPPQLFPDYSTEGVARYELTARAGTMGFLDGLTTPTKGFSGDYLGPTIRLRTGDRVEVLVRNELDEITTVHWHGLYVPAESDGGPHQSIDPGSTWNAAFEVKQQAATLWYHPHPMGATGVQVYEGMAGLLYIDDPRDSPKLPSRYGIDDIPLIIQDRRFYDDGRFAYVRGMPDVIHGIAGDVLLVNGVVDPVASVPQGIIRLRILNASDSNVFRLRFGDDMTFRQIASDGGFLERPVDKQTSVIATGERVEILVDTTMFGDGDEFTFHVDDYFGRTFDAMTFRIDASLPPSVADSSGISQVLGRLPGIDPEEFSKVRTFAMQTMGPGGQLTINGRHMDMDRIDFRIPEGSREIWEISNVSMGMMSVPHVFHIHNGQFRLISVNGKAPPSELAGRKDTYLLWPNDRIRVAVAFDDYLGVYMYHCHFLVHEDAGMMGQFEIFSSVSSGR